MMFNVLASCWVMSLILRHVQQKLLGGVFGVLFDLFLFLFLPFFPIICWDI